MLRIRDTFPMLKPYLPEGTEFVGYQRWVVQVHCFTTHRQIFDPQWALDAAGFLRAPCPPDGFFACGAHVSNYERLFVMWARGGRMFHFVGLYFAGGYLEAQGRDLYAEVRSELDAALARWEEGLERDVTNSGVVREDLAWLGPSPRSGRREAAVAADKTGNQA